MKLFLSLMISLISVASFGQRITKVACGEYRTVYLQDDSTVWATLWNGKYSYMPYPVKGVVGLAGGQYTCLVWTKDGFAYELGQNTQGGPLATKVIVPGKIVYGQMFFQAKLLVNDLGDLYYLAESSDKDVMKLGVSSTPKLILAGKKISKIAVGEDIYGMLVLTTGGEVLQWARGSKLPVSVLTGMQEIAMIGRGVFVAYGPFASTTPALYVWGDRCNYVGLPARLTIPTQLPIEGLKYPIKKMVGNWNTLHIIDADNNMWAMGENIMGEIGNGQGCLTWRSYKSADGITSQPYAWNWLPGQMIQLPIKLDGKWSDVFTSGSMAFYLYAIDTKGQLYSWGRNKKRVLGNGRTLPDNDLDAKYSDWEDQYYPSPVNPDKISWTVINSFDPNTVVNNAPFTLIANEPPPIQKVSIASNELAGLLKSLKPGAHELTFAFDDSTRVTINITITR